MLLVILFIFLNVCVAPGPPGGADWIDSEANGEDGGRRKTRPKARRIMNLDSLNELVSRVRDPQTFIAAMNGVARASYGLANFEHLDGLVSWNIDRYVSLARVLEGRAVTRFPVPPRRDPEMDIETWLGLKSEDPEKDVVFLADDYSDFTVDRMFTSISARAEHLNLNMRQYTKVMMNFAAQHFDKAYMYANAIQDSPRMTVITKDLPSFTSPIRAFIYVLGNEKLYSVGRELSELLRNHPVLLSPLASIADSELIEKFISKTVNVGEEKTIHSEIHRFLNDHDEVRLGDHLVVPAKWASERSDRIFTLFSWLSELVANPKTPSPAFKEKVIEDTERRIRGEPDLEVDVYVVLISHMRSVLRNWVTMARTTIPEHGISEAKSIRDQVPMTVDATGDTF